MNKIGTKIYIYIILLILVLWYPDHIGRNSPRNDANKCASYVPTNKRGTTYALANKLTKWTKTLVSNLITISESIRTKRIIRKNKSIAGKIIGKRITHKRWKRKVHLWAYPVLALLANHKNTSSMSMQRKVTFDTDAEHIGIDNRCSACISHEISDFIGNVTESKRSIKGFGGSRVENIMKGTLLWKWEDDEGGIHQFKIPNSYYVPSGGMRLLSPQHWAQSQIKQNKSKPNGIGCNTSHKSVMLYWNDNTYKREVSLDKLNNVATFRTAPGYSKFRLFCEQAKIEYEKECSEPMICHPAEIAKDDDKYTGTENKNNVTLEWQGQDQKRRMTFDIDGKSSAINQLKYIKDPVQEKLNNTSAEFLELHQKYGHVSFQRLREMAKQGVINQKFANCPVPICSACMFAKARRKRWRDKPQKEYTNVIPSEPGECVSVDQMVSPTPGLVAQMTGTLTSKRYKYATVFVDQATKMGYIQLQKSADVEETLKAKQAFEEFANQHGVRVRSYQADNGIFRANKWMDECKRKNQPITFTGVNAHHQNGIAERRIGILQELTRAMMIHAQHKWPGVVTPNLWPYAMRMANDNLNETPNMQDKYRRSSVQMFSQTKVQINTKHHKVFGCPTYVLDEALQQGNIFHKWKERSRVGIYLGRSPSHARNVSLVMNIRNGLVSPQFHVQHDNRFDTVGQNQYESTWQVKAGFVNITSKRKLDENRNTKEQPRVKRKVISNNQVESERLRVLKENETLRIKEQAISRNERMKRRDDRQRKDSQISSEGDKVASSEGGATDEIVDDTKDTEEINEKSGSSIEGNVNVMHTIMDDSDIGEIFCMETMFPSTSSEDGDPLLAYKAVADPDVMYLHQAMRERDRDKFIEAMRKEVQDQKNNGNFVIVEKSQVPKDKTILKSVWQMRRKRDIKTRAVKKYKARLNIDGSRMRKGVDYDDTYAPVAKWSTIRLILSMAAVHKWHTRQLDYVLAFPQAPVERELYMEIPKGFEIQDDESDKYLLKIQRNIYGQKQAGRVWNQYLVHKLTHELGFKQSAIDECLFYRGKVLYALYTDDSILAGPVKSEIDDIIQQMKHVNLNITDEGNVEDFLGVNIEQLEDGSVKLSQPHLIEQILKDLKMTDSEVKSKDTPAASSTILRKHESSRPFDDSFHYRSVIGKLNYLEKCTRPDIAYATHQCARFTEDPKMEHAKAVRWLARYLKGTLNQGIIMHPNIDKDLQMYVDADYAGNWHKEESHDRDTARSRHGYIITYHNCPIIWKSQMQTEIALSSTESEYIGISQGLRDVIPLMRTLEEMKRMGMPISSSKGKLFCRVFEDNSGALEMAKVHKFRPRTKHINVKYHHFRDYVCRGDVDLFPINTTNQPADMLTKPVNTNILKRHRMKIMGW